MTASGLQRPEKRVLPSVRKIAALPQIAKGTKSESDRSMNGTPMIDRVNTERTKGIITNIRMPNNMLPIGRLAKSSLISFIGLESTAAINRYIKRENPTLKKTVRRKFACLLIPQKLCGCMTRYATAGTRCQSLLT